MHLRDTSTINFGEESVFNVEMIHYTWHAFNRISRRSLARDARRANENGGSFTCSRPPISPRVHVMGRGAVMSRDFRAKKRRERERKREREREKKKIGRMGGKRPSISGRDTRTNGTRLFITTMRRASTADRAFTIAPYFIGQI